MKPSLWTGDFELLASIIAVCASVSGWLFDVAEIGKHWLSSESLGDFTSSHRRPSCRVPCTFHGDSLLLRVMLSTEFATKHPTMYKQPREQQGTETPGAPKSTQFVGAVAVSEENL
ncbi:hypothetical protein DBV15_10446 [Temnothorax longispinosus]|uniref:Uncharacterized protein n=1 Tax=Temnothorax longispinosus TaxID=300112 RepID=A0A4S2KMU6_9HYME|nr:hypothetical protein DBV15_10446 [Temnothorax longispinosus]